MAEPEMSKALAKAFELSEATTPMTDEVVGIIEALADSAPEEERQTFGMILEGVWLDMADMGTEEGARNG
jgi:hypothetical protein